MQDWSQGRWGTDGGAKVGQRERYRHRRQTHIWGRWGRGWKRSNKLNQNAQPGDGAVEKISKNKSCQKPSGLRDVVSWDSSRHFEILYANFIYSLKHGGRCDQVCSGSSGHESVCTYISFCTFSFWILQLVLHLTLLFWHISYHPGSLPTSALYF